MTAYRRPSVDISSGMAAFVRCDIAKTHTIFEGTSEIQRLVIARAIAGMRIE
jgi:alkylation response protein AidB-like acyl-CoA dehydrogenase